MNLDDCLKENVIAQSINRFCPMNLKTLKRNLEIHADEELYGIAHKVDREFVGHKILFDIYFGEPGDSRLFTIIETTMENNYLYIYGGPIGHVKEKNTAFDRAMRKSGLIGVTADDIALYVRNMDETRNYESYFNSRRFTDQKDKFIPLYIPGKEIIIPIPPTIF